MKVHFQRITLFVLLFATLLTLFLPFASSAAESDGWAVKDIATSDVMEDLKAMKLKDDKGQFTIPFDESLYPLDTSDKRVELITLYEHGYTKKDGMSKDYGVYLYLYNPSGQAVKDLDNMVNMCQELDANGNPKSYQRVPLDLVSASEDYRFLKFELMPSASQKHFQEYTKNNQVLRYYGVSSLYLNHGTVEAYSNSFGYIFSGYREDNTLKIEGKEKAVIDLNLKQTWYRLNSSPLGKCHYSTLNAVYFSVPDKLFEKYGNLTGAEMEWYEYKTDPVFYCTDQKTAETLKTQVYNDMSDYGYSFNLLKSVNGIMNSEYYEMHVGAGTTGTNHYEHIYGHPSAVFYSKDVSEEGMNLMTETYLDKRNWKTRPITGGLILENLRNQSSFYYDALDSAKEDGAFTDKFYEALKMPLEGASDYSALFFADDVDEGRTCGYNHVNLSDKNMQTVQAFEGGFLSRFLEFGFMQPDIEGSKSYPEIEEITDLYETNRTARDVGINEYDLPTVKKDCEYADAQKKRTFMLRFAVTDYFFAKGRPSANLSAALGLKGDVYASQQTAFLNLNVLSLTMEKEGVEGVVETTIAVNSDPIDVMPDPTTKEEEDMILGVVDKDVVMAIPGFVVDVFAGVGDAVSTVAKLPSIISKVLMWGAIILICIFAFKFFRWIFGNKKKSASKSKAEKPSSESTEKPKKEKKKKNFLSGFFEKLKGKKKKKNASKTEEAKTEEPSSETKEEKK